MGKKIKREKNKSILTSITHSTVWRLGRIKIHVEMSSMQFEIQLWNPGEGWEMADGGLNWKGRQHQCRKQSLAYS